LDSPSEHSRGKIFDGISIKFVYRAFYEDLEYPNIPPGSPRYQNFRYVWNSFWLIVVTMSTVGFGDFYPVTHFGRFVIVLACFWGMFIVSQFVYTLEVTSEFSVQEFRVFELLQRL
jgi:Ion channel